MIKKIPKKEIIRDNENKILCEKHKIFANSICIYKDCKNKINCVDCKLIDNHNHFENINISYLIDKKIDDQLFKEKFYDKEKNLNFIENEFEGLTNFLIDEINFLKNRIIGLVERESKEVNVIVAKIKFQESREKFLEDDNNFDNLKKLAKDFFDFF